MPDFVQRTFEDKSIFDNTFFHNDIDKNLLETNLYLLTAHFKHTSIKSDILKQEYVMKAFKQYLPIPMKPPLCSEMIAPLDSGMISPPV
ncbi:hypothetical protein CCGE525_21785 [Rhizobium jaguaris]|uniref:Uncharacterized protein n=1 Tax=Rhizobium jaguaris TaxID=1312183 RepID=A0A387FNX8_9HYPH|nr:hypothetical protein CCGE525_21785 [Rhizobium jaguaris]